MVTNTKFDVEKFDGTNNFGMWQCEVQDILFQPELDVALEESRPEDVDEKDWAIIDGDPPFIGGEEGGNPTSNRCGIPYFLKSNTMASDHTTIFLCTKERVALRRHRFRFENVWVRDNECRNLIMQSWNQANTQNLKEHIDKFAQDIEAWGSDKRKKHRQKLTSCRNNIRVLKI